MGILTRLLTSPVIGPLSATRWLAEKIHECAEREMSDPAIIRRELAALERALDRQEISEAEYDREEAILLARLRGTR